MTTLDPRALGLPAGSSVPIQKPGSLTLDNWLDLYTEGADQALGVDAGFFTDLLLQDISGALPAESRDVFKSLDSKVRRARGAGVDLVQVQASLAEAVDSGDERALATLQRAFEDRYEYLKLLSSAIGKSNSAGTDLLGNPADRFDPDKLAPGFTTGIGVGLRQGSLAGTLSNRIIKATNNLGMGFFLGDDQSGFKDSEEGQEVLRLGEQNFATAARDAMLVAGWKFQEDRPFSQRFAEVGSAFMADLGAFKLFGKLAGLGVETSLGTKALKTRLTQRAFEGAVAFGGVAGSKNAVRLSDGEISAGKALAETAVDTGLGAVTSGLNSKIFDGLMPRVAPALAANGTPRHLASAITDSAVMSGYDWVVRGHAPDPADFLAQTLFFGLYQTAPAQAAKASSAIASKLGSTQEKLQARHLGTQLFRTLMGARPGEPGVIDPQSVDAQARMLLLEKIGVEITEGGNVSVKNPNALREFYDVFGANVRASLVAMQTRAGERGDAALGLAVSPEVIQSMLKHYGVQVMPELQTLRGEPPTELKEAHKESQRRLNAAGAVISTYQQDIMATSQMLDTAGVSRSVLLEMTNRLAARDMEGARRIVSKVGEEAPVEVGQALSGLIERFGQFQQAQTMMDGLHQRIDKIGALMKDLTEQSVPSRLAPQALGTLDGFAESMRREGQAIDVETVEMARSAITGMVALEAQGILPIVSPGAESSFLRSAVSASGGTYNEARAQDALTLMQRAGMTLPYPVGSDFNATNSVLSRVPKTLRDDYNQAVALTRQAISAQRPSSQLSATRESEAAWESVATRMLDHYARTFLESTIVDVAPIPRDVNQGSQRELVSKRAEATMDGFVVAFSMLPGSHPLKKAFSHLNATQRKKVMSTVHGTLVNAYAGIVEGLRLRADLALPPDAQQKLQVRNRIIRELSERYRRDLEKIESDTTMADQDKSDRKARLGDQYAIAANDVIADTASTAIQEHAAFSRIIVALQAPENIRSGEVSRVLSELGLDQRRASLLIRSAGEAIAKTDVGPVEYIPYAEIRDVPIGVREDRVRAQEIVLAREALRETKYQTADRDIGLSVAMDREIADSGRYSVLDFERARTATSGPFRDVARVSDPRIDEISNAAFRIAAGLERGSASPLRSEASRLEQRPFAGEEAEQRALALRSGAPESSVSSGESSITREILLRQGRRLVEGGDPNAPLMAVAALFGRKFSTAMLAAPHQLREVVANLRDSGLRGRALSVFLERPEVSQAKSFVDAAVSSVSKVRELATAGEPGSTILLEAAKLFPGGTHVADVARFLHLIGVDGVIAVPDAAGRKFGPQIWDRLKIGELDTRVATETYLRLSDRLRQEWSLESVYTGDVDLSMDLRHAGERGYSDVDALASRAFSGPGTSPLLMAFESVRAATAAASALKGQATHATAVTELIRSVAEFRSAGGRIEAMDSELRGSIISSLLSRRAEAGTDGKKVMEGVGQAGRAAVQFIVDSMPESPIAPKLNATARTLERIWETSIRSGNEAMAVKASEGITEIASARFEAHPDERVRHRVVSGKDSLLVLNDGSVIVEPPMIRTTWYRALEESTKSTEQAVASAIEELASNVGQTEKTAGPQWDRAAVMAEMQASNITDPHGALSAIDQVKYEGPLSEADGIHVTLWNGKTRRFRNVTTFQSWLKSPLARAEVSSLKQSGRVNSGMLAVGGSLVASGLLFASGHWVVGAAFTAAPVAAILRARQNQRREREIMEKSYPFMSDWMRRAYQENERASAGLGQAVRTFVGPLFSITRAGGRLYGPAKDAYLYLRGTTVDGQEIGLGPYTRFYNQGVASLGIRGWSELHADLTSMVGRLGRLPIASKLRSNLHSGSGMSFLSQWVASRTLATLPVEQWTPERLVSETNAEYQRIESSPRARAFYDRRFLVEPDIVDVAVALESLSPRQRALLQESSRMLRYLRAREIKAARRLWKLREMGDVDATMTADQVLKMHDSVFESVGPTIAAYVTNLTFDRLRSNRNLGISLLQTNGNRVSPEEINERLNVLTSETLGAPSVSDKKGSLADRIASEFGMDRTAHADTLHELADALLTFGSMEQTPPHRYGLTRQMFTPWYIKRMREENSTIDFVQAMEAYVPQVLRRVYLEEAVHRANWTAMQNFKVDPDLQREMLATTAMITSSPGDFMPLGGPESWMQRDPAGRALSRLAYWKVLWLNPSQVAVETMGYLANPSGYSRPWWHWSKAKSVFLDKDLGRFMADLAHVHFIADHAAPFHGESYGLMGLYGRVMGLKEGPVDFAGKTSDFFKAMDELRQIGKEVIERKEPIGALTSRMKFMARRGEEYGQFLALAELITRTHSLSQGIHFWTTEALEAAGGKVQRITDESGMKYNAVVMPDGRMLDPFEVFAESYATKHGDHMVRNPKVAGEQLVEPDEILKRSIIDTDAALSVYSGVNVSPFIRTLKNVPIVGKPMTAFTNWSMTYMNQMAYDTAGGFFGAGSYPQREREIMRARVRRRLLGLYLVGGAGAYKIALDMAMTGIAGAANVFIEDEDGKTMIPRSTEDPRWEEMVNRLDEMVWPVKPSNPIWGTAANVLNAAWKESTGSTQDVVPEVVIGEKLQPNVPILSARFVDRDASWAVLLGPGSADAAYDLWTLTQRDALLRAGDKESVNKYYEAAVNLMGSKAASLYLDREVGGSPFPRSNPLFAVGLYKMGEAAAQTMNWWQWQKSGGFPGDPRFVPRSPTMEPLRSVPIDPMEAWTRAFLGQTADQLEFSRGFRQRVAGSKAEAVIREQVGAAAFDATLGSQDFGEKLARANDRAWMTLPVFRTEIVNGSAKRIQVLPSDSKRSFLPSEAETMGFGGLHPTVIASLLDLKQTIKREARDRVLTREEQSVLSLSHRQQGQVLEQAKKVLADKGFLRVENGQNVFDFALALKSKDPQASAAARAYLLTFASLRE